MNRSAGFLIATFLGAFFSIAAYPQEGGAYLGAALGQSKFTKWCDPTLATCDDQDSAWKLFGGYRFNRYIAVEGSYVDWGEVTAATASASVAADQHSYGIAAVGSLQVAPQLSVFGKLGILRTEQQTARITPAPLTLQRKETELHYGLGVKYSVAKNWGLRAEWENTDKLKVQMLSIGVEFTF
jgi:opacity protein-like surface antigen